MKSNIHSTIIMLILAIVFGSLCLAVNSDVGFKKCCPWDKVPGLNSTCNPKPVTAVWEPPLLFASRGVVSSSGGRMEPGGPVGRPDCGILIALNPKEDGPYYLLEDGRLDDVELPEPLKFFCYDWNSDLVVVPYICHSDMTPPTSQVVAAYPVGLILSLPFLAGTFLVYVLLKQLRNVHGLILICNVVSMFIGYLTLSIVMLAPDSMSKKTCSTLAYMIQFFFLAVFFWLNVMCFDIYWAFSGIRNLRGSVKEREHKKFILYTLYAWGGPLVLLSITLIMDYSTALPENSPYRPNMGKRSCFFLSDEGTWLYFYGPMAVLIFCNLLMFSITARRLFVHRRETSVLKSRDSKRHDNNDKERFHLYLKLFVVMGINWVMELVSWVLKGPQQIWYVTDITNTLQGVFIFIIFVCKPRILRLINQRLCPGKKLWPGQSTKSTQGNSSQATGSTTTSSVGSKKQAVSTINMKPVSEDSVRLNAEDSDGQI